MKDLVYLNINVFFFQILFLEWFSVYNNIERKTTDFQYTPCSLAHTASPIINMAHQRSTFLIKDECSLTHFLKSIVYLRINFQCIFSGFDKIYSGVYSLG